MKPRKRLVQLTSAALVAVAVLTACRKEVPPPAPTPNEVPKPKVTTWAHAIGLAEHLATSTAQRHG